MVTAGALVDQDSFDGREGQRTADTVRAPAEQPSLREGQAGLHEAAQRSGDLLVGIEIGSDADGNRGIDGAEHGASLQAGRRSAMGETGASDQPDYRDVPNPRLRPERPD